MRYLFLRLSSSSRQFKFRAAFLCRISNRSLFLCCLQLLLGGVEIDQDNNIALLDKEMASMRQGRTFLSQINDNIPRSRSSMEQMVRTLEDQRRKPLTQVQFENLILSLVYSAYQQAPSGPCWSAADSSSVLSHCPLRWSSPAAGCADH
uniref:Uncharacterized protein n=1 Tax=Stegastes partitus TaxID=144197 RepID=A0A3B5A5I7_9TELE